MIGKMSALHRCCLNLILSYICIFLLCGFCQGQFTNFRRFFTRTPNQRLSALPSIQGINTTVEDCARRCVVETGFECKSFDFDNAKKECILFGVNLDDLDIHLIITQGRDHYRTAYKNLFTMIPKHRLHLYVNRNLPGVSVEECARRCMLETYFKCKGFNYRNQNFNCYLMEETPGAQGLSPDPYMDYYQKKPEGPLQQFVNYGIGRLQSLPNERVYQKDFRGIPLEECASKCLTETTFYCVSFDYTFEGDHSVCHMSKYIAANVYGLSTMHAINPSTNHFERVEKYLDYFYSTPYALIPGNNLKTYERVTPNRCALLCMKEPSFVCRSFDYQIKDGTCMLSSKTQSDTGGLYTDTLQQVHHFEMKPLLDCGGNLSASEGNFASPNWPRSYAHHETCVWRISTAPNKVIRLEFTHFQLGLKSGDPCDQRDDRLEVLEKGDPTSYCVMPNTKIITTKSNEVTVSFFTNAEVDGQGFRVFYSAEWTCDVHLGHAPGQIASPKWPGNYPSSKRCTWRITAPDKSRVRLHFTSFQLEQHTLGHCNEVYDHVRILNGGTVGSPLIGLYCGIHEPFTVRSSNRDMLVQFLSDSDPDNPRQGFHATYLFESTDGLVMPGNDSSDGTYIDLDGIVGKGDDHTDPGQNTVLTTHEADKEWGKGYHVQAFGGEGTDDSYKTVVWALLSLMLIALVAMSVILFLICRHYRRKLRKRERTCMVESNGLGPDAVPLRPLSISSPLKQNNLGNEVDLTSGGPGPNYSLLGATGGAAAESNLYDPHFEKYAKDNLKNVNIDQDLKEQKELNTKLLTDE